MKMPEPKEVVIKDNPNWSRFMGEKAVKMDLSSLVSRAEIEYLLTGTLTTLLNEAKNAGND